MIAKIKSWLAAAGVVVGLVLAAFVYGSAKGSQSQKDKQDSQKLKNIQEARKIEKEINGLSGNDVSRRLDRFMRD